ncbi:MAG: hypothetical protein EZS28_045050, partial [Streblomastix strix]
MVIDKEKQQRINNQKEKEKEKEKDVAQKPVEKKKKASPSGVFDNLKDSSLNQQSSNQKRQGKSISPDSVNGKGQTQQIWDWIEIKPEDRSSFLTEEYVKQLGFVCPVSLF